MVVENAGATGDAVEAVQGEPETQPGLEGGGSDQTQSRTVLLERLARTHPAQIQP